MQKQADYQAQLYKHHKPEPHDKSALAGLMAEILAREPGGGAAAQQCQYQQRALRHAPHATVPRGTFIHPVEQEGEGIEQDKAKNDIKICRIRHNNIHYYLQHGTLIMMATRYLINSIISALSAQAILSNA